MRSIKGDEEEKVFGCGLSTPVHCYTPEVTCIGSIDPLNRPKYGSDNGAYFRGSGGYRTSYRHNQVLTALLTFNKTWKPQVYVHNSYYITLLLCCKRHSSTFLE